MNDFVDLEARERIAALSAAVRLAAGDYIDFRVDGAITVYELRVDITRVAT